MPPWAGDSETSDPCLARVGLVDWRHHGPRNGGGPLIHDLIIVGGTPAGISLAAEARKAGLDDLLIIESGDAVAPPDAPGRYRLEVRFGDPVERIVERDDTLLVVETAGESFLTRVCAVAERAEVTPVRPDFELPATLVSRIHFGTSGFAARDEDVLIVGRGERAIEALCDLVGRGGHTVLCFIGDFGELSSESRRALTAIEREQRATILWQSQPGGIDDVGGFPMAVFPDRQTPDLQFDHVVFTLGVETAPGTVGVPEVRTRTVPPTGLFLLEDVDLAHAAATGVPFRVIPAARAWARIREERFPHLPAPPARRPVPLDARRVEHLRAEHYNATITSFDPAHSVLWRIGIRPDSGDVAHRAGQYVTLGLGYWEPRIDDAPDPIDEAARERLIRRSYSISSPIFDSIGYLADPITADEIELYVVLVPPGDDTTPALTPRLALKHIGDRVYLGPKVAGRYTLDPVDDPLAPVVFLATGTGEAPHNAMVVELLRKGHHGPIVSAVSVRLSTDLAYTDEHRRLMERHANYRYLGVATRDPGIGRKRYLQDLIVDGTIEEALGTDLDPRRAHVFICGNPAMIGIPEWDGSTPRFPDDLGACRILYERGFRLDRRGVRGRVHYEEYW
jgi:ferredoxin/flavodoxin---NADP+ reductase